MTQWPVAQRLLLLMLVELLGSSFDTGKWAVVVPSNDGAR